MLFYSFLFYLDIQSETFTHITPSQSIIRAEGLPWLFFSRLSSHASFWRSNGSKTRRMSWWTSHPAGSDQYLSENKITCFSTFSQNFISTNEKDDGERIQRPKFNVTWIIRFFLLICYYKLILCFFKPHKKSRHNSYGARLCKKPGSVWNCL